MCVRVLPKENIASVLATGCGIFSAAIYTIIPGMNKKIECNFQRIFEVL